MSDSKPSNARNIKAGEYRETNLSDHAKYIENNYYGNSEQEERSFQQTSEEYFEFVCNILSYDYTPEKQKIEDIDSRNSLEEKRKILKLSPEEANQIEERAFKSFQEHSRNVHRYQQALSNEIQADSKLTNVSKRKLKALQNKLGLEDDSVATAHAMLGNKLRKMGNLNDATIQFKYAVNLYKKKLKIDSDRETVKFYEEIFENSSKNKQEQLKLDGENLASAYLNLGVCLYLQGNRREAIEQLTISRDLFWHKSINDEKKGDDTNEILKRISDSNIVMNRVGGFMKGFFRQ